MVVAQFYPPRLDRGLLPRVSLPMTALANRLVRGQLA
jgi:hypothetical protein